MNLDNIKDLWHNQDSSATKVLQEVPQPGNARGPLDRIRKNMKKEFYAQVIAVILIGFFPYHFNFRTELVAPFIALYAVIVAITVYILVKYYFLYRKLSNNTLSSKDHLYALHFDIRLNMEMYKTFVYILVPFVLMSVGMVALNDREGLVISSREIYVIAGSSIVFMLMMAAVTSAWVNYFYGKYARQIKALLDDLKEG
jgi:hypothetical protein